MKRVLARLSLVLFPLLLLVLVDPILQLLRSPPMSLPFSSRWRHSFH